MATLEHLNWHVEAYAQKFEDPERIADAQRRFTEETGLLRPIQADELIRYGYTPEFDELWDKGNALLNNGINRLLNLLIGTGSIGNYANGTGRLGTGNGSTAVAATDTDLSAAAGSSNRWFQIADSTYPSVSAQTLTMKATFGTADGNYAWNEWGIDGGGGTSANTVGTNTSTLCALLNRKVPATSLGTKTSAASWALTTSITVS